MADVVAGAEEDFHVLSTHLNYHKQMLTSSIPETQIGQFLRFRHVTYKLKSGGTFTPDFGICSIPPVVVNSEVGMDGLHYNERMSNGYMVRDYEDRRGGHYKCGKLARENPGVHVYSVCGCGDGMTFFEYSSSGTPIPIDRDAYETSILRKVDLAASGLQVEDKDAREKRARDDGI